MCIFRPHDQVIRNSFGILNLTANADPYKGFDALKVPYYNQLNVPFLYLYNEPQNRKIESYERLFVSATTHFAGIPAMYQKFVWQLTVLLNDPAWSNVHYFVRTNASTFINIPQLKKALEKLPNTRCYAGSVTFNQFISGTCIILSRDVCHKLIQRKEGFELTENDDTAIANYMKKMGIKMRNLPMKFYIENQEPSIEELSSVLHNFPLVRIKNADKALDLQIWKHLVELSL